MILFLGDLGVKYSEETKKSEYKTNTLNASRY